KSELSIHTKSAKGLGLTSTRRLDLRPRQALVHVHHQRHAEQRGGEVDDRDRHESRDEKPGEKDRALVGLAHGARFLGWAIAHGGELEIFAAEQIGGRDKEDDQAKSGKQQERYREEIDQYRQQRRLDPDPYRKQQRQRNAGGLAGIFAALDFERDLVHEKARDQRGHRRHEKDRAHDDADAGRNRQHPRKDRERRMVGNP